MFLVTSLPLLSRLMPAGDAETRKRIRSGIEKLPSPADRFHEHLEEILPRKAAQRVSQAFDHLAATYLQGDFKAGERKHRKRREKELLNEVVSCFEGLQKGEACAETRRQLCTGLKNEKTCQQSFDNFLKEVRALPRAEREALADFMLSDSGLLDLSGFFSFNKIVAALTVVVGVGVVYAIYRVYGLIQSIRSFSMTSYAGEKLKELQSSFTKPLADLLPDLFPASSNAEAWTPNSRPSPGHPSQEEKQYEQLRKDREEIVKLLRRHNTRDRLEDMSSLDNFWALFLGTMDWSMALGQARRALEIAGIFDRDDDRVWTKMSLSDLWYCLVLFVQKAFSVSGAPLLVGGLLSWLAYLLAFIYVSAKTSAWALNTFCADQGYMKCAWNATRFLFDKTTNLGRSMLSSVASAVGGRSVNPAVVSTSSKQLGAVADPGRIAYNINQEQLVADFDKELAKIL